MRLTHGAGRAVVVVALGGACAGAFGMTEPSDAVARQRALEEPARDSFITDDPARIVLSGSIQFRYQANFRDDGGLGGVNGETIGFAMRRAKIAGTMDVTDNLSGKFQVAFSRSSGDATLEVAEIDWALSDDFTLRAGQFKLPLLREWLVSASRQLASERSAVHGEFTPDYSQAVELAYTQERWRVAAAVSDGINSDNTVFTSAREADFAVTGRAELLLGEAGFKPFGQFTSFRGATRGAMVGVAGHWQTGGDTNPESASTMETAVLTADLSLVGSGWNAFVAGIWRSMDVGPGAEAEDLGLVVQGGLFVTDDDEVFARYQGFFPDDFAGATDLHGVTAGWNHYFSPESHAAKFTLDVSYWFDAVTPSGIAVSDGNHLLADTEDGQVAVTAQVQLLF